MPEYDWTCHVCGRSNEAACETCVTCDCPAIATGKEIFSRKKAREPEFENLTPEKKRFPILIWLFLFFAALTLFYTLGYYVAGNGAESAIGFIAFVVAFFLSLVFGVFAVAGILVGAMNLIQRFIDEKNNAKNS